MKDRLGRIIYVGKAKALKKRVSSYFQPSRAFALHPKIRALVEMIADFDAIELKSEPEAILLEGKLIKQWKPRYNTDFTDDKRFLLVRVDPREALARFRLVRLRKDDRSRYFGPFAHSGPLRKTLAEMRRRFGILLGDGTPRRLPDGSWQLYDDVRGEIYGFPASVTEAEYGERVERACAFLEGKSREWLGSLRSEMGAAAGRREFERAAGLRDIVLALEKTLEQPRHFERTDPTALSASESALESLQRALALASRPGVIECFDISHISGTFVVASMVRFAQGRPDRDNYRRFRIKGFVGNDDYRAMEEVVGRRYRRLRREGRAFPDLLVIDGGRGQVAVAADVLAEQGLHATQLIGIAKGPERKPGLEEIVFADRQGAFSLPADNPGLHLLQQIRDEAHRFAIQGHRARRGKARMASSLQEIGGIGAKRRHALLAHFGGLKGIQAASVDDLARVPGISRALAERIFASLH